MAFFPAPCILFVSWFYFAFCKVYSEPKGEYFRILIYMLSKKARIRSWRSYVMPSENLVSICRPHDLHVGGIDISHNGTSAARSGD